MKILLVNSHYTEKSFSEEIMTFLEKVPGVWQFELGEKEIIGAPPPYGGEPLSWSSIFDRLEKYRETNQIPMDTFILFLTEEPNEPNWFGIFDTGGRPQGFVQTSYWDELVSSESIYPILYEIVAIPLHWRMFRDASSIEGNVHMKPIGCINDFCQLKQEVILKLQTGNICSDCYKKMMDVGIDEPEFDHIDSLLDNIRMQFRVFNINRNKRIPSPLRFQRNNFFIGEHKLRLSPIQRAVYLFFLSLEENIRTVEMMDYEEKILDCYQRFYNGDSRDEMVRIAGRIARNEDNLATQSVSRINSVISGLVIPELADHYKILTDREGYKSITAHMV